jgi:hypothetical protein
MILSLAQMGNEPSCAPTLVIRKRESQEWGTQVDEWVGAGVYSFGPPFG